MCSRPVVQLRARRGPGEMGSSAYGRRVQQNLRALASAVASVCYLTAL